MLPITYNVRSLLARKRTTIATALGIAIVVFVFTGMQMFSSGIERALGQAGERDVAVVLAQGASGEKDSSFPERLVPLVGQHSQIVRGADGQPVTRADVVAAVRVRVATGKERDLFVRGMFEGGLDYRRDFRLTSGRPPRPGSDEAIIGDSLVGTLGMGQTLDLGRGVTVEIVGTFSVPEAPALESEVWANAQSVQRSLLSPGFVSVLRVRLTDPSQLETFRNAVESDKQLGLRVLEEKKYYELISKNLGGLVSFVALLLVVCFSIASALGAAITMHASIASRRSEIAILRALGFPRRQVLATFLLESCMLSLVGGLLGTLAAMALGTQRLSFPVPGSSTTIALPMVTNARVIVLSVVLSIMIGLAGGFLPALGAAAGRVSAGIKR